MVLSKLIGIFSEDYQVYIIVFGLITLIPLFVMIWNYSEKPTLSLMLFYAMGYLTSTSVYRQWLATAVLMFSIKYIYERKLGRFLLCVIVASLFHRTAIVFFVAYFLYSIWLKKSNICLGMFLSIILIYAGPMVLRMLNRFARMEAEYSPNGGVSMWIVLWGITFMGAILSSYFYDDYMFRWPFNMVLFAAVIQPIAFTYSNWARMVQYFGMFSIILLPKMITGIEDINASNKRLSLLIECVFMMVMFVWFSLGGIPEYLPMWR